MSKVIVAMLMVNCCVAASGFAAQTTKSRGIDVNDILSGLVMGAADSEMCGENILGLRIRQSAGELIAVTSQPHQVGPRVRSWNIRTDNYRDVGQATLGIRGKPTNPSNVELCNNSVSRARRTLQRSDDAILKLAP